MFRVLLCLPLCMLTVPTPSENFLHSSLLTEEKVNDDSSPLPDAIGLERLARDNPVGFLETCLKRYQRTVKGYTCTFQKQERLEGRLQSTEIIDIACREEPFSVYFQWSKGERLAERSLYVEGENEGSMLARPAGKLARAVAGDVVIRDPEGRDARQSGRYSIKDFGLKKGSLRTLASWKAAKEKGTLHVEYLGEKKVKEAGDRLCYVLKRTQYEKPEEDGIIELTTYIDKDTWLQVGSVLKGEDRKLIAEYFFRDIRINPEFKAEQFKRAALMP